jgi:hypothetical protein
VTKPNPFDFPVVGWHITFTAVHIQRGMNATLATASYYIRIRELVQKLRLPAITWPCWEKASLRAVSFVSKERPALYHIK